MPNWVMNELTCIFQTKEEFESFKNRANTEGLYASFFPMPAVLEGTTSPHIAPGDFINSVNKSKEALGDLEIDSLFLHSLPFQMAQNGILDELKRIQNSGLIHNFGYSGDNDDRCVVVGHIKPLVDDGLAIVR